MASRTRTFTLFLIMMAVALSLAAAAGEMTVRLFVPKEIFWPVSQIYQPVAIPGVRYTYRPSYSGSAFGVPLQTNRFGFRGGEWTQRPDDSAFRIALIGDSYAFGYGVPFEASVGEQLRSLLDERFGSSHEVLNFGVNGHNARQYHALLHHLALDFEPDLVILLVTNNDHEDAFSADADGWLHWDGESANEQSRVRDNFGVATVGGASWLARHSRLFVFLKLQYKIRSAQLTDRVAGTLFTVTGSANWMADVSPGPPSDRMRESVYEPLHASLELLQRTEVSVILASACVFTDCRQMLLALARDAGVPLVDLFKAFPEASSWPQWMARFSLGWDQHPNAAAHRRFAETLVAVMAREGDHRPWSP